MKLHYGIALLLSCPAIMAHAQNFTLPSEWYFTDNDRQLHIGGQPVTGFYELNTIRQIELQFSQPDWWDQMTANEPTNTRIPATLIVDGVQYDSVGVRFKGSTSEEIETTQKRSFNISVDHYIDDQNVMGYNTIILDNCSNDPSFMREVVFSEMIRDHVPTSKANFSHLQINGESWGLYPSIQDLNSSFMREWFFTNNGSMWRAERPDGQEIGDWGDGTAALNWLGPDSITYQEFYDLERTEQFQPWAPFVKMIDKLNNTPLASLEDTLNKYMDVDRTLWFLAAENAFSDRSSYIRKGKDDYFVYYEPESGRMNTIEFDGRTSMRPANVMWSPFMNADDTNYPLLNRLLSVPSLRQRYLAHMRTFITEKFQSAAFNAFVDGLANMIDAEVQADSKKLYTYTEFLNEVIAIKEFVNAKRLALNSNFEIGQTGPQISNVEHLVNGMPWAQPLASEQVNVRATVTSASGILAVDLYYSPGIVGRFLKTTMFDDGAHNDGSSGDGVYGATIPAQGPLSQVRYYIAATANNAAQSVTYLPAGAEHKVYTYLVQIPAMTEPPVRINEIMALNLTSNTDQFNEHDDWIELFNTTAQPYDLSGLYLSDNGSNLTKWQFPLGSVIQPLSYMILWADDQAFQGDDHVGFGLGADGESLWLSDQSGVLMDHVIFGPQTADVAYARRPNGVGPFEYQEATFGINNDLVSVPELDAASPIRFFPNPASQSLTITSETPIDITIHNALMQVVYTGRINARSTIDAASWPAGSYYLRAGNTVQKVMVIR